MSTDAKISRPIAKWTKSVSEMEAYGNLAAAIVQQACADYVEALKILNGDFSQDYIEKKQRKLWKAVLRYGERRYIYRDKKTKELTRQREKNNLSACREIARLVWNASIIERAEGDKMSCEAFFRSGAFDIFMPNTDGEDLIKALQRKAEEGATIAVNYYY